jgi:hypothetical protein
MENGLFYFINLIFIYFIFIFILGINLRVVLNKFDQFIFTKRAFKVTAGMFISNLFSPIPTAIRFYLYFCI